MKWRSCVLVAFMAFGFAAGACAQTPGPAAEPVTQIEAPASRDAMQLARSLLEPFLARVADLALPEMYAWLTPAKSVGDAVAAWSPKTGSTEASVKQTIRFAVYDELRAIQDEWMAPMAELLDERLSPEELHGAANFLWSPIGRSSMTKFMAYIDLEDDSTRSRADQAERFWQFRQSIVEEEAAWNDPLNKSYGEAVLTAIETLNASLDDPSFNLDQSRLRTSVLRVFCTVATSPLCKDQ